MERSELETLEPEFDGGLAEQVPDPHATRFPHSYADKILFPRQMLYIEAVLYLLIALAAFGAGFLIGRGRSPLAAANESSETVPVERVRVEGLVTFERSGNPQPQEGAVIVVVPVVPKPLDRPIPIEGLRPKDAIPGPKDAVSLRLKELGGATTRSDSQGRFSLYLPRAGHYRILILSAERKRTTESAYGGIAEKSEWTELTKYFAEPASLLLTNRYRWYFRDVKTNLWSVEANFSDKD